ncbi:MAG: DEAD/DEAH box helicase [Candidatus Omnitrophica bacterium]|nr:DEAD/DEAH box helicase [Candidatus Omnitrophota bacterium]
MKFYGLFIGIDRYASPTINWLNCAKCDAKALYGLFTDNLGNNTKLLIDKDASRAAIELEFNKLSGCSDDDVVVIAFSGHGTETHELVTYDADRSNLTETCIPLDVLSEWLFRIRTNRLIFILDCCFSGGMGAKALQVDMSARELRSTEELLKQLSGEGRLIITASLATEKAWENQKYGHGLLTYHLLSAIQGVEEVTKAGKIGVYRLLEYVTQRVIDDASKLGKPQHPTLRGTINGDLTWPVFKPGALYQSLFPERTKHKVTTDVKSLTVYGFPQELLKVWAGLIPSLNQLQVDAINEFNLLDGEHIVVSAPTSSGKTMIGELAALKNVLERKRAIFLFPLKALVNDKFRHFTLAYQDFGIKTIRATGDSTSDDILPLMRGQYDICLMTYEKFSALVLGNPHILEQVGTVVIDEVQMIADESRGVNLEFILTLLKMRRRQGIEPQLIALSAVIGDTNGLERWLNARLLKRTERPIPLDEGVLRLDGSFRFISAEDGKEAVITRHIVPEFRKGSSQDLIIPLVRKLVSEGKSVIVFRETRGEARGCALYLAETLGLAPAQSVLDMLPNGDPSLSSQRLRDALAGGTAFHISDLDTEERLLIEEQFRASPTALKVISATTTLAMGVNTPAEAVVIAGLMHPGNKPYSIAEYKNIIGRAGRLGFTKKGTSYVIAQDGNEEYQVWRNYVLGSPEDLNSKFLASNTDPRSLIVRVLTAAERSGQGLPAQEIIEFLEQSFGVFQRKQIDQRWVWDEAILKSALDGLVANDLIKIDQNGLYHLTQLGRLSGEAGVEVESIIRFVRTFKSVDPESINDPTLIAVTQISVELNDIHFPINKKSTQKEPQTWMSEIRNQGVPECVLSSLRYSIKEESQSTLRAKKAVACLLWITDKPLIDMEDILTQFGGKFDGAAGPIRSVVSRTCDILPVVARVVEILYPGSDLNQRVSRFLVRLELGVSGKILEIAMRLGKKLTRGDYLRLLSNNICTMNDIENLEEKVLLKFIEGDKNKLSSICDVLTNYKESRSNAQSIPISPILPQYES